MTRRAVLLVSEPLRDMDFSEFKIEMGFFEKLINFVRAIFQYKVHAHE